MSDFFDRAGHPIDVMEWAKAFEDFEGRTVARTQVGPVLVLTVWLGTDEDGHIPPRIFGSIIKIDQKYRDEIRTATEEEALKAHTELVALAEQRLHERGAGRQDQAGAALTPEQP